MGSESHRDENMSDDLTLFSSPELKDTVQDMRDLLSQSRLAYLFGGLLKEKQGVTHSLLIPAGELHQYPIILDKFSKLL
jgi:hypothetical protein